MLAVPPNVTLASIKTNEEATKLIARIIEMEARREDFDRIMAAVRERVVPAVRGIPGFHSDCFAGDAETGRIVSFVLWETPEGAAGAEALFQKMSPQMQQLGLSFTRVENLEVLLSA